MKTLKKFKIGDKSKMMGTTIPNSGKKGTSESKIQYQCPMKCHGEEVYDESGICPDSKMQMIPVGGGHIFY
ncbi:MAG: heavy metal-binding domain-containing protein [Prolixibacteraceae bacterium]|jgi:hypothetical protein